MHATGAGAAGELVFVSDAVFVAGLRVWFLREGETWRGGLDNDLAVHWLWLVLPWMGPVTGAETGGRMFLLASLPTVAVGFVFAGLGVRFLHRDP